MPWVRTQLKMTNGRGRRHHEAGKERWMRKTWGVCKKCEEAAKRKRSLFDALVSKVGYMSTDWHEKRNWRNLGESVTQAIAVHQHGRKLCLGISQTTVSPKSSLTPRATCYSSTLCKSRELYPFLTQCEARTIELQKQRMGTFCTSGSCIRRRWSRWLGKLTDLWARLYIQAKLGYT